MERILIVDADTEFRNSLFKILLKAGYSVSAAPTAQTARALLEQGGYRLVLIDVLLANGSGWDFLAEVKQTCPECQAIVITANGDARLRSTAYEIGAFAFLRKPVKRETILYYTALALNCCQAFEGVESDE